MNGRHGRFAARGTLLAAAAIGGFGASAIQANAQTETTTAPYRIVGELSEADIMSLWPPARLHAFYQGERQSNRRFFRSYRTSSRIPLGDWIADVQTSHPAGVRLTEVEAKLRLKRGANDRDFDGVPDEQDVYPWDRTRW